MTDYGSMIGRIEVRLLKRSASRVGRTYTILSYRVIYVSVQA